MVQSLTSRDTSNAVRNLSNLAAQAQLQTRSLDGEVKVLGGQLKEQRAQTALLGKQLDEQHAQTRQLSNEANAAQESVRIGQNQLAANQAKFERDARQAAAMATYTMRLTAFQTWLRGNLTYEAALDSIREHLTVDIERPAEVNALTLPQLLELQHVVEPIVAARRDELVSFRTSLVAWPHDLRQKMVSAGLHGDYVGICFEQAALHVLNEPEAVIVRRRINANCGRLIPEFLAFTDESKEISDAMTQELYDAERRLGTKPEEYSPSAAKH